MAKFELATPKDENGISMEKTIWDDRAGEYAEEIVFACAPER